MIDTMNRLMRFFVVISALFVLLSFIEPAQAAAPTSGPSFTRQDDIIYGRSYGSSLTFDLFKPTGKSNGAAIIVVNSGGWISVPGVGPGLIAMFIEPFVNRGYTVFVVSHACQPRYQIPEIIDMINRSVRFIRYHAKDYGIDPMRLGITGGSAGGHLSLMQALGPKAPKADAPDPIDRTSSQVQAVACLFPPTDFLNWGKENQNVRDMPNMAPFLPAFDFHEPDPKTHLWMRILDRQRINEIEKDISPIYHATPEAPPTMIIHGDADPLVPIQQSHALIDKLKAEKVPAELVIKQGGGHGWLNAQPELQRIGDWFDKYLAKPDSN